jgi:hypothetical protein
VASISRVKPFLRSTLRVLTLKTTFQKENHFKFDFLERAALFDETLPSKLLEKA